MQIHAIYINHLLFFDTFAWESLDLHLHVIVSPISAGKPRLIYSGFAYCPQLLTPHCYFFRPSGADHMTRASQSCCNKLPLQWSGR